MHVYTLYIHVYTCHAPINIHVYTCIYMYILRVQRNMFQRSTYQLFETVAKDGHNFRVDDFLVPSPQILHNGVQQVEEREFLASRYLQEPEREGTSDKSLDNSPFL